MTKAYNFRFLSKIFRKNKINIFLFLFLFSRYQYRHKFLVFILNTIIISQVKLISTFNFFISIPLLNQFCVWPFSFCLTKQIANHVVGELDEEAATEYSIIGQTNSISSTIGSSSSISYLTDGSTGPSGSGGSSSSGIITSSSGNSNSYNNSMNNIGSSAAASTSTRQYATVTQSSLIHKKKSPVTSESSEIEVSELDLVIMVNDVSHNLGISIELNILL